MTSLKYFIIMLFLVICCFIWKGQSLSIRQKRSGTADQELFHLLEKMKHRPVAGIIDVNRIGKRQPQDNYSQLQWKLRAPDEEWPIADQSYFY